MLFIDHWRRSVLGATLMITQSFLYNSIFFTYVLVLTRFYGVITAYLFHRGMLTATTQTIAWCVIFFFASVGASAAYLTVSEISRWRCGHRPSRCLRYRPVLRRHRPSAVRPPHRHRRRPSRLFVGYLIGGAVMVLGGIVEIMLGVPAERQPREAIARPLSALPDTAVPRAAGAATTFSPRQPA